jgi:hypothetical protein
LAALVRDMVHDDGEHCRSVRLVILSVRILARQKVVPPKYEYELVVGH